MEYENFLDMVAEMRRLQKEYSKSRSSLILDKSKRIERHIDAILEEKRVKEINNPTLPF